MSGANVFEREKRNPIVTPDAVDDARSIFNSAVIRFEDAYAGVFRVDSDRWLSQLHVGHSKDGLQWEIDRDPISMTPEDPHTESGPRLNTSPYDPRVTEIDGIFYVTFCNYPGGGGFPAIGLATTKDFQNFRLIHDVILPYNRNAVLFPRKIGGKYAMLHRPSDPGHTAFGDVFYAQSPDLTHWGQHRFVFGPTQAWQSTKVGPGPVPIEIDDGWLLLYHGVKTTCSGYIYCVGGAILDLEEPWRVRHRTKRYLLAPTEPYERIGDVPNVVFPCAAIVDEATGRLAMYYGGADTCVAVAYAQMDELIEFIRKDG